VSVHLGLLANPNVARCFDSREGPARARHKFTATHHEMMMNSLVTATAHAQSAEYCRHLVDKGQRIAMAALTEFEATSARLAKRRLNGAARRDNDQPNGGPGPSSSSSDPQAPATGAGASSSHHTNGAGAGGSSHHHHTAGGGGVAMNLHSATNQAESLPQSGKHASFVSSAAAAAANKSFHGKR
jgi:hypothetical protein